MNPADLAKTDKTIGGNVIGAKNVEERKTDVVPAVSIQTSYPEGEFKINDTRVIYVKKGTSYLDIAQRYEIALPKLFEFNDLKPSEVTSTDELVFIQRKRKTGEHEFHVVQVGEDLHAIAQTEAIRLESLLEYNNLAGGMQPAVGETLSLRSKTSFMPRLLSKNPLAQK
jgi:LysM repeat protein